MKSNSSISKAAIFLALLIAYKTNLYPYIYLANEVSMLPGYEIDSTVKDTESTTDYHYATKALFNPKYPDVIAACGKKGSADNDVQFFTFGTDGSFTAGNTFALDSDDNHHDAAWSPDGKWLVLATDNTTAELRVLEYDHDNKNFKTTAGSSDLDAAAHSVTFRKDGAFFFVGIEDTTNAKFYVYTNSDLKTGTITESTITIDTGGIEVNSLDCSIHNYLAVATTETTNASLKIYDVSDPTAAANITLKDSIDYDNATHAVSWHPSGNYIAVGTAVGASTDELRVFSFSNNALTEIASYNAGEQVNTITWLNHSTLLIGLSGTTAKELQMLSFDPTSSKLELESEIDTAGNLNINGVSFHRNKQYFIAASGDTSKRTIYSYQVNNLLKNGDLVSGGGYLKNGFTLENVADTKAYFDFHGLVSGDIDGNDKAMELLSSLRLSDASFINGITVVSNGNTILLEDNCTIDDVVAFSDSTTIDGRGQTLTIASSGQLEVTSGTLELRNMILDLNNGSSAAFNIAATHKIKLNDVSIRLPADALLSQGTGTIDVANNVVIEGGKVLTHKTSTLNTTANATLFVEADTEFKYDGLTGSLLTFADNTAHMILNGGTFNANTDCNLEKGTIVFDNEVTLKTTSGKTLQFGDGTAANNCTIKVLPAAKIFCQGTGKVRDKNV